MSLTGDPLFIAAERQYRAEAWSVAPRAARPVRRGTWWRRLGRIVRATPTVRGARPDVRVSFGPQAMLWSLHPVR